MTAPIMEPILPLLVLVAGKRVPWLRVIDSRAAFATKTLRKDRRPMRNSFGLAE
jgi:hypothetical protein